MATYRYWDGDAWIGAEDLGEIPRSVTSVFQRTPAGEIGFDPQTNKIINGASYVNLANYGDQAPGFFSATDKNIWQFFRDRAITDGGKVWVPGSATVNGQTVYMPNFAAAYPAQYGNKETGVFKALSDYGGALVGGVFGLVLGPAIAAGALLEAPAALEFGATGLTEGLTLASETGFLPGSFELGAPLTVETVAPAYGATGLTEGAVLAGEQGFLPGSFEIGPSSYGGSLGAGLDAAAAEFLRAFTLNPGFSPPTSGAAPPGAPSSAMTELLNAGKSAASLLAGVAPLAAALGRFLSGGGTADAEAAAARAAAAQAALARTVPASSAASSTNLLMLAALGLVGVWAVKKAK